MDLKTGELDRSEFTQNQLAEIDLGIEAGIDVSVYAKKEYLTLQMREIRLGLMDRLDISCYANPVFDWLQMEEIRKGMISGVNVSVYGIPEISYDKMQQIRLGLEVGIDLSGYHRMDAGILKQLRLAVLGKVSLFSYISAGYDADQLEAIRIALEKKLDIAKWVKPQFRGIALQEIFTGIENGVDVSVYADEKYNWMQMKEIRLGLEHMIDVRPYMNVFYTNKQMQEIRMGIEQCLDVSYYLSPMYTAADMRRRRLELEEDPTSAIRKRDAGVREKKPDKKKNTRYRIRISEDEMEAYLDIDESVKKIERLSIVKAMHRAGVDYGILFDEIDRIIKNHKRKNILVAKGKKMVAGEDGRYEYFFCTDILKNLDLTDFGSEEYHSIKWYETVEKGQRLAYYHEAGSGEDGYTVTGTVITAKKGREKNILMGKGFKRLSDGKTYVAQVPGIITLKDQRLNVDEIHVVTAVNMATGDLMHDGSVLVEGNISNGMHIQVSGDLIVNGFAEASRITCGGNVILVRGINGGSIRAEGDVIGSFFEETDIHTEGNVRGDYFFRTNIKARGEVKTFGKKATIIGGNIIAEAGLLVSQLGNAGGQPTRVEVGFKKRIKEQIDGYEEALDNARNELALLRNAHAEFKRRLNVEIRMAMPMFLKIESAIYTKEKQIDQLTEDREKARAALVQAGTVRVDILEQVYEGVTIVIDETVWKAENASRVTITKNRGRIAVRSLS